MTELDWRPSMDAAERRRIDVNYRELLGERGYEHFAFVPFMADLRPAALMRYRLWVDTVTHGVGLDSGLPNPPYICLVMGHFYTVLRYPAGIYGDLAVARTGGAQKAEVADLIAMAWLHSGPFGVNTVAQVGHEFMDEWEDGDEGSGMVWPDGWQVDHDVLRCGVDFDRPPDPGEVDKENRLIEEWYLSVQGEVPSHVGFLARQYPLALRAYRARWETSMVNRLPKQLVALCQMHLAASWREPDSLRRTLHMCKELEVSRDHVVQVLTLAQFYLGDIGMDAGISGAEDLIERWWSADD